MKKLVTAALVALSFSTSVMATPPPSDNMVLFERWKDLANQECDLVLGMTYKIKEVYESGKPLEVTMHVLDNHFRDSEIFYYTMTVFAPLIHEPEAAEGILMNVFGSTDVHKAARKFCIDQHEFKGIEEGRINRLGVY